MKIGTGKKHGSARWAPTVAALVLIIAPCSHPARGQDIAHPELTREITGFSVPFDPAGPYSKIPLVGPAVDASPMSWTDGAARSGTNGSRSLFDKPTYDRSGNWAFEIGVWVPYSTAVLGRDFTVTAGFGTTLDAHGKIIGFRYYNGVPSQTSASTDFAPAQDSYTRPIRK